ncbi:MAG: hypothetical protein ACK46O_00940 [Flavobacteriia bacterium]|jgi:SAM-dependent methyltransferase
MLYEEAQWIGDNLTKTLHKGQQILNLGSSTLHSRTVLQPHMNEFIFQPLKNEGIHVIHSDITIDEGVDLQGDFTDPGFIEKLKNSAFDGVLCCNLLEHLEDRSLLVNALNEIIPDQGFLMLTVPYQYPYHLDPIDTLYRPNVDELVKLFPEFILVEGEVLQARRRVDLNGQLVFHKNYFEMLKSTPTLFGTLVFRACLPFYKYHQWKITVNDLKNIFKPFSVTCILLVRKN